MIIHKESKYSHWIYSRRITCAQCDTEYQLEEGDNYRDGGLAGGVRTACPKCKLYNTTYKGTKPLSPEVGTWAGIKLPLDKGTVLAETVYINGKPYKQAKTTRMHKPSTITS